MQHVHYYLREDASTSGVPTPFRWRCRPLYDVLGKSGGGVFDAQDTLAPFHPLFVIPHRAAQAMRDWSEGQTRNWSVGDQP